MSKPREQSPLAVRVKGGQLLISIGVETLAHAAHWSDWANPYSDDADDYIRTFMITDVYEFARDVKRALLHEREDGSSLLSDVLDKASEAAIDDGSMAAEYDHHIPFRLPEPPHAE